MTNPRTKPRDDRAQIHTLEGLAASIIILLAVTYVFNAFVITPTADVNPGTESNQKVAQDLLEATYDNERLVEAVLHWDDDNASFVNSTPGTYYYEGQDPDPDHLAFGSDVREVLTREGLSYNIMIRYPDGDNISSFPMVYSGRPGGSAVTADYEFVLTGDENLTSGESLDEAETYPIPRERTATYNRVNVRLTVW